MGFINLLHSMGNDAENHPIKDTSYPNLLQPGKIGNVEIRNHMVMPGMGTNVTGHSNPDEAAWYAARAKGGFGLVISEYNCVTMEGIAYPGEVYICEEEIPGYQMVTDEVHKTEGAKIFMQIHHAGRQSFGFALQTGLIGEAPSAIPCTNARMPVRELSTKEIWDLIDKFGKAGAIAKKGGFDGCELHFGHGYLGSEFMSSYLNKRTDEFGGTLDNRARFACECIKAIKKYAGSDFPILVRVSGDEKVESGRTVTETAMFCALMEKAGADGFNISLGTYANLNETIAPSYLRGGYNLDAAAEIKQWVRVPVMSVGRYNDPAVAELAIAQGKCDYVLLGRQSIADPEFPNKVKEGRCDEIIPCIGCLMRCQGHAMDMHPDHPSISCTFNPFSGFENQLQIHPAEEPKNIVIVGGGFAGLEAAWVSAACGHKVTLIEKGDRLGGQANVAMMPPEKSDIARVIVAYSALCRKYGVEIKLNTEATKDTVTSLNPQVIILATGATPIAPTFENDGIPVVQAWDILSGKIVSGSHPLIIGGGQVGLETAEYLISQLRPTDIVEMKDECTWGPVDAERIHMQKLFAEHNIQCLTGTKVKKFTADGALCENADGDLALTGYDQVILALGARPYNPLEEELKDTGLPIHILGDAGSHGGTFRFAIDDAAWLCTSL